LILETVMPYALFEDDERLTRSFATEQEAWEAAERAGLVELGAHGEKILDNHLEIRPCEFSPDEVTDPGSDFILS
jgi:hypothetical protein